MTKLKNLLKSNNAPRVIAIIILLYSLAVTLIPNYKSEYDIKETNFKLNIIDYEIDGNKLSLTLKGKEKIKGTYYIKTIEEKEYLEKNLELDALLKLTGTLIIPNNNTVPNLFNYKEYLYHNKIYYILNIDSLEIISKTTNIFYKIKNYAYTRASNIKNNEYIYAYILGNTDNLDDKILNTYRTNGISHLFALSGLHVGIFSIILMKILNKFKIKDIFKYIIVFGVLLLFAFITGFSPSMLRAVLLFFLLGLNKSLKLEIKTINILYITFSIIVLINPFIIYQVGFILSFVTTFFLIYTTDLVQNKSYYQSLLIVSTISFFASMGVSIYYFGSINPVGILLNLIFVPLISFIIFPLTLIVYILPFMQGLLYFLTSIMETMSTFLIKIKLQIYFPKINIIGVLLYYIFLILLFKTKKRKTILLLIITIIIWKTYPYLRNETLIYFIDVGQGDSCLIVTPHNKKSILIDTGGKISFKEETWKKRSKEYKISTDTLIPFMRSIGVNKLNYVFLTHGDADHAGEFKDLSENFKIDKIYINKGEQNSIEKKAKNAKTIDFNNIEIDNIKIQSLNEQIYSNENDNSIVLFMKVENTKILLMGDASTKVESDILSNYNLETVDILKVGHHGSITSSKESFIKEINPKYSIISVGKNNRYGHPNKEVLTTLEKSKIYRTDVNGSILFKINKGSLEIQTFGS